MEVPPGFSDHDFRSSSGTDLGVRVWPADPPVSGPAPFVVWTHGGGWLGGYHFVPLPWMVPGWRQRGYHLVSHNYRLGPQTRLDDQLADSLEAVAWCRANLQSILGPSAVDVNRYVLCGESAGGHLVTLMALHLPDPQPRAVVDVYGLVDFLAFQVLGAPPQDDAATGLAPWDGEFSEEELEVFLGDRDPAKILTDALPWAVTDVSEDELSRRWGTDFRFSRRIRLQTEAHMYRSLRRKGTGLLKAVMHPEKFATEEELTAFVHSMSPFRVLQDEAAKGRKTYPPTAFLHGSGDTDVPIEQSYALAAKLKEMGVPVIERYEDGEPHVFDQKYTSPEVPGWDTTIQPILEFVDKHTGHNVV
ncbi:Alpha/Beta hydrolase protein [Lasiosphaeria miniovina]|uniref:Alpha/Beta hydrolase protein n=1 Tax=Lasiosphaeria miniovina TaxID=1954250 RepID=A0AA40B6V5_9PEZI|nr:Alpha/Beta hydrolase protein [Lasiosphaeria miniovina]KAK0728771.1 Alpha/Beta hydrolase protein [Lasiosphaeria miniovina]